MRVDLTDHPFQGPVPVTPSETQRRLRLRAASGPEATRREPGLGLPAPRWAGWNQTGHRVESRREAPPPPWLAMSEDAFRACFEYDQAVLNQGEGFPPVTYHLRPGWRIEGSGLVHSGFRPARML